MSQWLRKMGVADWILYPVAGLAVAAGITGTLWYTKPSIFVRYLNRKILTESGLVLKTAKGKDLVYTYAERGQPSERPSILLIHGIASSKSAWLPLVNCLPSDLHVILLDLSGHGDTTVPSREYTILDIVADLHEFVHLIGLSNRPFHIVGNSLGSTVAALFASKHPDLVHRLTLAAPGVQCPIETDFLQAARSGQMEIIPTTVEEMITVEAFCSSRPYIPSNAQLLKGMLQIAAPTIQFQRKLFSHFLELMDTRSEELESELRTLVTPTQIVWGQEDKILHVSGATMMEDLLPNCLRVDIFEECGHMAHWEQTGKLAAVFLEFYRSPMDVDTV